jgi:hypothetical protein
VGGAGFAWAVEEPAGFDASLSPVRRPTPAGLDGVFTSGVEWVLREARLLAVLERVTGDAGALHEAAVVWMEQALVVRGISARVREAGAAVAGSWYGEAARAFGGSMGAFLAVLDGVAVEVAATAHLLNEAGVVAAAAQDLVTDVVVDAAEWVAAELAATAVADVLTLGLATIGGALAESATLGVFVGRAERISAEFAAALERIASEMAGLRAVRDGVGAAHGVRSRLRAVREGRDVVAGLPATGGVFRAAEGAADAVVGMETGLPLDGDGVKGLGSSVAHSVAEDAWEAGSGR